MGRRCALALILIALLLIGTTAQEDWDEWDDSGEGGDSTPAACQSESDGNCPDECTKENDYDCWTITDTLSQLWVGSCTDVNGDTTEHLTEGSCRSPNVWDGTTGKMFFVCIGTFFGSLIGMVIFVVLSIQERAEVRKAEEQKLDQYKGQPDQESAERGVAGADYPQTDQVPAPPQDSAAPEQPAEQQQSWGNESSEGWSDSEGGW